jgi:hypothetical protein
MSELLRVSPLLTGIVNLLGTSQLLRYNQLTKSMSQPKRIEKHQVDT